jgi:glycosyltransferase involved in cell wall biosynthesis
MERSLARPPRLLAILPGIGPTGIMYIIKPMLALERQGLVRFRLMLQPYFRPSDLNGVDVVQFCRNVDPRYAAILDCVRARRIPYTYELDDDLFAVPPGTEDGVFYNDPLKVVMLERFLHSAALVRVYSRQLVERVHPYTQRVVQVSPLVDWARMQPSPPLQQGPVKIVYATSRRDDYLYSIFTPAALELLRRYPTQIALYFWGFQPPEFADLPNVHYFKYIANYDRYLSQFARQGFEIGLAPLVDDEFHRSKTDTKFREYGACAIAGVYSRALVYTNVVQDGQTGLLVDNTPAAWLEALIHLVEDRALRQRIGQAAQQDVRMRYDPQRFHETWMAHIRQVLSGEALSNKLAALSLPTEKADVTPAAPQVGKLARPGQILQQGGIQQLARHVLVHLVTLSWLFKINCLKRV